MQFSGWKRSILYGGLAVLLLLSIVVVTAPVKAGPNAAPPVQRLPTRPKPTSTPKPSKPSQPSSPTSTPVPAATETPTSTNTPAPTATQLPTSTPTPTHTPTPTPIALTKESWRDQVLPLEGQIEIAFGELAPGTQTLNRDNVQIQYRVDLPGNLRVLPAGSSINLASSHFPQEPDEPSTVEVEVNGRLLSEIGLNRENADKGQTRIDLPARLLAAGANQIVIRLKSGAACEDVGALLSVEIDASSLLSFGYEQRSYPVDLARYPLPFSEKGLLRAPVTLVLPDEPTAGNLSAAMSLAARLGQASEGQIDLRIVAAKGVNPNTHGAHHLIVLGRPETHTFLATIEPEPAVEKADLKPEEGFLELAVSPLNEYRLLLIVSGADDAGITKASHALNFQERFPPIRGATALIADLTPPQAPDVATPQNMTLRSLGGQDETIYGAEPARLPYDFMLPPGWQLTGAPLFTLKFSHSNVLDPTRSVLDVSLNGQPVGNAVMDDSNATDGQWEISLPQRALQAGRNRLEIGIEMTLPGAEAVDRCKLADDKRLWTVISSESEVFIPYSIVDYRPDLGLWPYPYAERTGMSHSVFVLPDQPEANLVSDLLLLGARLGAATDVDYLPAHVQYASETERDDWQNSHLVLLGRATQNALLQELNQYLPRPFAVGQSSAGQSSGGQDSDVLAPVAGDQSSTGGSGQPAPAAFQLDPKRDTGVLQTLKSPWNRQRALLAVAGTTDKGVRLAMQALWESSPNLEGNIAIIDPVSGDTNLISVYATDTRPAHQTINNTPQDGRPAKGTTPEPNTILLAQRWWK